MCLSHAESASRWQLRSADGSLELSVSVRDDHRQSALSNPEKAALFYAVARHGKPCVLPSRLGLGLAGAPPLVNHFRVLRAHIEEVRESVPLFHGEQAAVDADGQTLLLQLEETLAPGRRLNIRFRTFADAIAFQYEIPEQPGMERVIVETEQTCFRFPEGCKAWETLHAQGEYRRVEIGELGNGVERPLTVDYPDGALACIAEACMRDHPRAKLGTAFGFDRLTMRNPGPATVFVQLHGPATGRLPWASSWRVIFFAQTPAALIGRSDLLQALCPPPDFDGTGWIRAGKCMRVMELRTEAGLAAVDFAAENGLAFIEFDGGWYGNPYDDAADPTRVSIDPRRLAQLPPGSDLDLPRVIAAARAKGIGVFLYLDRRLLERHLERLLPVYRSWGIAGIKFGFVQVGQQAWAAWIHHAVRRCADYQILVDIHDEYRPTGLSRTFPNLLTQEGIRGNEEMPSAGQNTILPFTRLLAGAADYTPCHRFPDMERRLQTTPAHQLAMAVVYFSPLQFLFWYGSPAENAGLPELDWYKHVPTVWDETVGITGAIGEYVAVARRAGENWFLGAMTNDAARTLDLPLDFLEPDVAYRARMFSDSDDARPGKPTPVVISEQTVQRDAVLRPALKGSGGVAVMFRPVPQGSTPAAPHGADVSALPAQGQP